MITLTAEVVCNRCKTPIASGEPVLHPSNYALSLELLQSSIDSAMRAAKSKGAIIGIVTAWCADCELAENACNNRRVMACGCSWDNRELCPHGNSPLA